MTHPTQTGELLGLIDTTGPDRIGGEDTWGLRHLALLWEYGGIRVDGWMSTGTTYWVMWDGTAWAARAERWPERGTAYLLNPADGRFADHLYLLPVSRGGATRVHELDRGATYELRPGEGAGLWTLVQHGGT